MVVVNGDGGDGAMVIEVVWEEVEKEQHKLMIVILVVVCL